MPPPPEKCEAHKNKAMEREWEKSREYQRILELLDDYWLSAPDEKKVVVDMKFYGAGEEFQSKHIVWHNPNLKDDNKENILKSRSAKDIGEEFMFGLKARHPSLRNEDDEDYIFACPHCEEKRLSPRWIVCPVCGKNYVENKVNEEAQKD